MSNTITGIQRLVPGLIEQAAKPGGVGVVGGKTEETGSFSDMLSGLVNSVNDIQHESAELQQAMLNGDPVELHDVMIKLEEAGVATDLLLEVRNKLLDGFKEIMNMPM